MGEAGSHYVDEVSLKRNAPSSGTNGGLIWPRQEDGHGSSPATPSFMALAGNQVPDPGNSAVITSASSSGHLPGTPFVGAPFATRAIGIQECFTLLTAFGPGGVPIADLSFTFTFRGLPEGVVVTRTIRPFALNRLLWTTRWLSNQWTNYQVEMAPSRPLVPGETIVVSTVHSRSIGNNFLYPINHSFRESEEVAGVVMAFNKGVQPDQDVVSEKADGTVFTYQTPVGAGVAIQPPHVPVNTFAAGIDTDGFRSGEIVYESDQPTATAANNGILVEITLDASVPAPVWIPFQRFEYTANDINQARVYRFATAGDGLRVSAKNNPVAGQGRVNFQFNLHAHAVQNPTGALSQQLVPANLAIMTQGKVIMPDVTGGNFRDLARDGAANGSSLNAQVTFIDDDIHVRPPSDRQCRRFIVGQTPVRIDLPVLQTPGKRRHIGFGSHTGTAAWGWGASDIAWVGNIRKAPPIAAFERIAAGGVEFWAMCEPLGVETPTNVPGTVTGGTASGAANVLTSNDVRASIAAVGQTILVSGFAYGVTNPIVKVEVEVEARKQSSQFETVALLDEQDVAFSGTATPATPSLAASTNPNTITVVEIARNGSPNPVNSVSGGGLTFIPLKQNETNGSDLIDVYYAVGAATAGAISVALQNSTNGQVAAQRFTMNDIGTPVVTATSTSGTGTPVTGPSVAGTAKGFAIMATIHNAASVLPGAGYTERTDLTNGSGSNTCSLHVETKPLVAAAPEVGTATLSSSSAWLAVGIAINPQAAIDPILRINVESPSGTPGPTNVDIPLTSTVEGSLFAVFTNDRAWTQALVNGARINVSGLTIGAAAAEVDLVRFRITDSTGASVEITVDQWAGADT